MCIFDIKKISRIQNSKFKKKKNKEKTEKKWEMEIEKS